MASSSTSCTRRLLLQVTSFRRSSYCQFFCVRRQLRQILERILIIFVLQALLGGLYLPLRYAGRILWDSLRPHRSPTDPLGSVTTAFYVSLYLYLSLSLLTFVFKLPLSGEKIVRNSGELEDIFAYRTVCYTLAIN